MNGDSSQEECVAYILFWLISCGDASRMDNQFRSIPGARRNGISIFESSWVYLKMWRAKVFAGSCLTRPGNGAHPPLDII
jgi:hypothetical protein